MNGVTLKQLRYFEALARHRHFGRAAEVCAISQPALSMQIQELENQLGAQLVERRTRQVHLTALGEEIVARARTILRSVDDLATTARAAQSAALRSLRLGIIPTIAPYLLPQLVRALGQAHPGIDLNVRETRTSNLIDALEHGAIDAAVLALPISEPQFEETPLFEEPFVLVRPEADRDQPVPDGDALRKMRLLLLEEGHCFRDQALSFCEIGPGLPRDGLDGSSLSTLVQMVAAGMGVTLIPQMAVSVEAASAPVAVSRFADPVPTRTVGMVWRRSTPLRGHLQGVATLIKGLPAH